jgi:hypothetical protein
MNKERALEGLSSLDCGVSKLLNLSNSHWLTSWSIPYE